MQLGAPAEYVYIFDMRFLLHGNTLTPISFVNFAVVAIDDIVVVYSTEDPSASPVNSLIYAACNGELIL